MDSLNEQFGQIYDQYIDKIYRFVYLKVNSQEAAEDITSKVFLKGWEAFNSPKAEVKNQGAFLYQIARNAVVDHYREKGRSKVVSVDDSPEIADPGTDSQEKAILSADINVIKKGIQKLEKEYQDIIIWHYLEDIPIANIAELTGRPAGTIRVMLHRGLNDLRNIIQEA
jgi:RNA polymerase sigma-70 factor (ECF subfamily)